MHRVLPKKMIKRNKMKLELRRLLFVGRLKLGRNLAVVVPRYI